MGDPELTKLYLEYPNGTFVVPAGSLGFSVSVFTGCALLALGTLSIRRRVYGAELGGTDHVPTCSHAERHCDICGGLCCDRQALCFLLG